MVLTKVQSKPIIGKGSRWPLFAILGAVVLCVAFLFGYWSWLEQFRAQIVAGMLMTALAVSLVLVLIRAVTVVFLVGMMVRAFFEPINPDESAPSAE